MCLVVAIVVVSSGSKGTRVGSGVVGSHGEVVGLILLVCFWRWWRWLLVVEI